MLGFLSKTKPKKEEVKAQAQAHKPPQQDNLKDGLSDPLAQSAQRTPEQAQTEAPKVEPQKVAQEKEKHNEKEKEKGGPGFFDRLLRTQTWKRHEATKKAAATKNQEILEQYWDAAYKFSITENAAENFDCYQAIKGSVTKSSIYNIWLDPKSDNNINVPGKVLKPLMDLAAKGQHDQMDFGDCLREVQGNMADTLSRFQTSDAFLKAIMARM